MQMGDCDCLPGYHHKGEGGEEKKCATDWAKFDHVGDSDQKMSFRLRDSKRPNDENLG